MTVQGHDQDIGSAEHPQPRFPQPQSRRALRSIAHVLSEVFSPFAVVAVLLVVVALQTDPLWFRSAAITVVPIAVVPLALSLYLTHRGLVTDRYILHRRQRHLFYALTLGSVLAGTGLVFVVPSSPAVRLCTCLAVGTLLTVMAVNTRIKISVHALMAALAAVVLPGIFPSWSVLVVAVLAWTGVTWSRVHLGRHQVTDVVLGSVLGGFVGALFLVLVGMPSSPT